MTLKLPRTIRPEAEALLRDGVALAERLLHTRSQKDLARELHTTTETMKKAREYHGIPTRPANMPPPPSLEGMAPKDVLADPNLTKVLMDRAYSKAGICPPYCVYWGLKTCPKGGQNLDAPDDEEGAMEMHRLCPIKFYLGPNGAGPSPLLRKMQRVAARVVAKEKEKEKEAMEPEQVEEKLKVERTPDTPEGLRAYLKHVTEGG
jgi:hypothetical protein